MRFLLFFLIENCSSKVLTVFCSNYSDWNCEDIATIFRGFPKYELIQGPFFLIFGELYFLLEQKRCDNVEILSTGIRRFNKILPPRTVLNETFEYKEEMSFAIGFSCPKGSETLLAQSAHWSFDNRNRPITVADERTGLPVVTVGHRLDNSYSNVISLGPSYKYIAKSMWSMKTYFNWNRIIMIILPLKRKNSEYLRK